VDKPLVMHGQCDARPTVRATLTVGLASHWPCITSGLSTYGLNGHGKGDEHRAYALEGHGTLYFTLL